MPAPHKDRVDVYHRERAVAERRAAMRAQDVRARAVHLELAYQHELAQAIAWYREEHAADRGTAARLAARARLTKV